MSHDFRYSLYVMSFLQVVHRRVHVDILDKFTISIITLVSQLKISLFFSSQASLVIEQLTCLAIKATWLSTQYFFTYCELLPLATTRSVKMPVQGAHTKLFFPTFNFPEYAALFNFHLITTAHFKQLQHLKFFNWEFD